MTETAPAQANRYVIDSKGSRLTIQAFATGLLSAMGHNPVIGARDISGEVGFAPETLDVATLHLTVKTASLTVQNDVSDKDRREIERTMREQVLEIATYPEIVYDGSQSKVEKTAEGRYRVEVDGPLTLHGETRGVRVSAQVFLMGDSLRAQGDFAVRQNDFGIKPVSVAGGTLKLKDELKCSFDLLTRKAT